MSLLTQFYNNTGGGALTNNSLGNIGVGAIPPGHIAFYGGSHAVKPDTYGNEGTQATAESACVIYRTDTYFIGVNNNQRYGGPDLTKLKSNTAIVVKGNAAQIGFKGAIPGNGISGTVDWKEAIEISGIKFFQAYQVPLTFNFDSCEIFTDIWFEGYERPVTWNMGDLKTCVNVGRLGHYSGHTSTWNLGSGSDPDAVSNLVLQGFSTMAPVGTTTVNGFPLASTSAACQAYVAATSQLIFTS